MTLWIALAAFGLAVAGSWLGPHPRTAVVAVRRNRFAASAVVPWLVCAAASVLLVVTGATGLAGHTTAVGLGQLGGLGAAGLRTDPLSGLFLVIAFGVAVPVTLAGATSAAAMRPRLAASVALTLGAVEIIVTATHLFVLLFGWELLTGAFYLLTGHDRALPGRVRASVAALAFGKASGAALLLGGAILAAGAHTFALAGLGPGATGAAGEFAYALLLFGFGVKVGLVPVQVWLPPSYANAPPAARAVMAGVAVNVGFYGMWRTLALLGPPPVWLIVAVLVAAGVTAILGIAHAAVHADLRYLIAWSSVENAGVITAGFGVAMVGASARNLDLVAAGLVAATAQVCAHALGKSLLFVAAGAVESAMGSTDLDILRGVARRMPWAGAGLAVGACTLAGLPLTAGLTSEWLTLEALMQQFRVHDLGLQLSTASAGALVALTIGIAGVTFVRLVGLTVFGHPPVEMPAGSARRADHAPGLRAGVGILILGCLGVAAVAPLELRMIASGLVDVVGTSAYRSVRSPWVLQPVFADFSALSPSWLWIELPALSVVVAAFAVALSGRRMWHVRRVPAWSSASPGVQRGVGYTSFGFANPIRKVLANLLLTRGGLDGAARAAPSKGSTPSDAPQAGWVAGGLGYRVDVVEVIEYYIYRPLGLALVRVVRVAKKLQSGRLDAYMAYMLIALVAVLAVATGVQ